jgi:hypothetical protein
MNDLQLYWFTTSFVLISCTIIIFILSYKLIKIKEKYELEKKKREDVNEINKEAKIEEPSKPKTRKVMMEITVINNKTDKEYIIKSENNFGLVWEYAGDRDSNYSVLCINQKHNEENKAWTAISRFYDFSVMSTVWNVFDIESDTFINDKEN